MAPDRPRDLSPDEEPTDAANLRIRLQRARFDEDFKPRRAPGPMRLITTLTGLIRHQLSKRRP